VELATIRLKSERGSGHTFDHQNLLGAGEGWTTGLLMAGRCASMKNAIPDPLNTAELERYSGKTAPEPNLLDFHENCYRYVDLTLRTATFGVWVESGHVREHGTGITCA
jgi:hypothetical protein